MAEKRPQTLTPILLFNFGGTNGIYLTGLAVSEVSIDVIAKEEKA